MPFTEVDAAHYLGQVLRRQLWQEQSLFYSGKSSKSTVQITIFIHLVDRSLFILGTFGIYTAGQDSLTLSLFDLVARSSE